MSEYDIPEIIHEEELPLSNNVNGIVNWQKIADWLETEGNIEALRPISAEEARRLGVTRRGAICGLYIAQKEREPLEILNEFLISQGIEGCRIRWESNAYRLECTKRDDVRKIVKNTREYFITKRKKKQLEDFDRYCQLFF